MSGTKIRAGGTTRVTDGTEPRECCLSGARGDTAGRHGGRLGRSLWTDARELEQPWHPTLTASRPMTCNELPCAICGSVTPYRLVGRTGCVCVNCLGDAAKQMIARARVPNLPTLTASHRRLLCGEPVVRSNIAATRGPYTICQPCVLQGLERMDDPAFVQVEF